MVWRPWLVVAALVAAFLVNGVLLLRERIPEPADKPVEAQIEPLRHLEYRENNRRRNLTDGFGMDQALAERTGKQMEAYGKYKPQLAKLLKDHAEVVTEAFCPTDQLPQPYAALEFLVTEVNGRRDVIAPDRLVVFESQEWFQSDRASIAGVYNALETTGRREDATLMGVSAVLLGQERDVLEGNSPWSTSLFGTWGFAALKRDKPSIEQLAMEYFALMHVLTELANGQDGICT
jgi:hypothetical protein